MNYDCPAYPELHGTRFEKWPKKSRPRLVATVGRTIYGLGAQGCVIYSDSYRDGRNGLLITREPETLRHLVAVKEALGLLSEEEADRVLRRVDEREAQWARDEAFVNACDELRHLGGALTPQMTRERTTARARVMRAVKRGEYRMPYRWEKRGQD